MIVLGSHKGVCKHGICVAGLRDMEPPLGTKLRPELCESLAMDRKANDDTVCNNTPHE